MWEETLVEEEEEDREMAFDVVNNRHEHPLIFYRDGKFMGGGRDVCCSICHEPWSPPAFSCSECNFHIHQSCIHFPSKIQTPFHHHPDLFITITNNSCNCCSHKPFGKLYQCRQCNFIIDLQCAIVDTKASGLQRIPGATGQFRHFAHPHPLTLHQHQQRICKKVVCLVCQLLITSGATYFCSRSNSYFHKECAELHREILNLDYHQHPLFLFSRSIKKDICCSCKNKCTNFFYSCPPCHFNIHVACLSTFKHQHDFTNFRKLFSYVCQLCGKPGDGEFPWYCSICQLFAHGKCAILKMSKDDNDDDDDDDDDHPLTHSSHDSDIGPLVKNKNGVTHFSHEHDLTLCTGEDRPCDGCMKCILTQSQSYSCLECDFHLHEECARLPKQHKNSLLHEHELSMVYIPDFVFSCAVCLQYCHGFAYHCAKCYYTIDIRCIASTIPFTHPSHCHPLFHYNGKKDHKCQACGEGLQYKQVFGCDRCNFYLDARCAHMPLVVRNRFDEHPLVLTFVNVPLAVGKEIYKLIIKDEDSDTDEDEDEDSDEDEDEDSDEDEDEDEDKDKDKDKDKDMYGNEKKDVDDFYEEVRKESGEYEYYCDICEEERMEDAAFYQCRLCCFAAHPRCILGDYPFLKSAKCEAHQHSLSMVKQGKKEYSACGVCGKSCDGKLVFECGPCKFNVHAFGLCYYYQLIQGLITFIMPSLRDRSIPFYLAPNEIKETKLTSWDSVEEDMVRSKSRTAKREFLRSLPVLEGAYFRYKQKKQSSNTP